MRRAVGLFIVGALAVVALGAAPMAGASKKATNAKLKAELLTLKNLPSGWAKGSLLTTAGAGGKKSAANLGCLGALETAAKGYTTASVTYAHGTIPILLELVASGPKPAHAYSAITQKLAACHTLNLSADGQTLSGTVNPLSFPTVGTASTAYDLTLKSSAFSVTLDLVVFHAGKSLGGVGYINIGAPKITTVESYVNAAVAKVEGHAVTTPAAPTGTGSTTTATTG